MSSVFNFIRENHILATIESCEINNNVTLNLSYREINTIPKKLYECRCLFKLYLSRNFISEVC